MSVKIIVGLLLGLAFLAVFGFCLSWFSIVWPAAAPGGSVGAAMWEGRTAEVLFQGFVILSGVFAILLLLGVRRREAGP
jgi:hypothetical protein